jgi:hypothetical protein
MVQPTHAIVAHFPQLRHPTARNATPLQATKRGCTTVPQNNIRLCVNLTGSIFNDVKPLLGGQSQRP